MTPGSIQSQPTGQPAWWIKKLQPKGYMYTQFNSVRTLFNGVCTFYKMYVAFCTFDIRYKNPWYTGFYIVRTRLYDRKRVHKCINRYIHVWTMYVHVHTTTCMYHVHTMYIHVYTFTEMYIHWHVCTCLCFSIIVYTMSVSRCTLALSKHCTYMVQTCLYTFMPGGQDSRCTSIYDIQVAQWHMIS